MKSKKYIIEPSANYIPNKEQIDIISKRNKKTTQGSKKLKNYFIQIAKTELFENEVKRIRKKWKIPENGYNENPCPGYIPNEWPYCFDHNATKNYNKDLTILAKKFNLYGPYWECVFSDIVFVDATVTLGEFLGAFDICYLENEYYKKEKKKDQDNLKKMFPVVLRISPHASIRDIHNYINSFSNEIKSLQKSCLTEKNKKVGKVRSKKEHIQERNNFIYENRNLPRKKIMEMVTKEFKECLDYGHIGKIISLENKKRKEM